MTPENLKECLKTVVGLARRTCPCDGAGKPVDAGVSQSGYFLTDGADGIPLKFVGGAADCGSGGVWDILEDARTEGIADFTRDLSVAISERYEKAFKDFSGRIGELNDTTYITNARRFAVVRLRGYSHVAAKMKLISASLKLSCTSPTVISVWDTDGLSGTPVATVTVNAVGQTWQTATWGADLDLKNDFHEYQDYYLTYEIPAGCFAANSTTGCYTCSGGKQKGWQPYTEVQSYSVDNLSDFAAMSAALVTSHGDSTLGISLDARIGCNMGDWLCGLDFEGTDNGYSLIVAKMLQYAQVMKLATVLVNSPNVNAITMLSKEGVYGKRSHAAKEYENGIRWIAQELPEQALRCYKCKDVTMAVRRIIV